MKLKGSLVALITPMLSDCSIDFVSYKKLIDFHLNYSDGIVVAGTTGECATLDQDEHIQLIEKTVEYVDGRLPVIAGVGSNCTKAAIELTRRARTSGADYGLSVTPYYNRPSQEGIYQHYKAIAESTDLPLILYNVPSRTSSDLHDDTTLRLTELPSIVGLKDATGNLQRAAYLMQYVPKEFGLYSGDDGTALAFLLQGGHGVISVTANVVPKKMKDLCAAAQEGNIALAKKINNSLQYLHRDLFIESNPVPTKWALKTMGFIEDDYVRLPLAPVTPESQPALLNALKIAEIQF